MGRHRAPDSTPDIPSDTPSVVRMTAARHSSTRSTTSVRSTTTVRSAPVVRSGSSVRSVQVGPAAADLAGSPAFVDDLTLITADDQLLDCIAAGHGDVFTVPQQFSAGFPAGSLAPLLATWRSEIVDPQWPSVPTADQAQEAVRAMHSPAARHPRRALKPMVAVAVAISALLFGSAAVGAQSASPGDALWPLTRVLYSDRAASVEAGQAAWHSLDTASHALESGLPKSALAALDTASVELAKVSQASSRTTLAARYQTLFKMATSADSASSVSSAQVIAAAASTSRSGTAGATSSSSASSSGAKKPTTPSTGGRPTQSGTSGTVSSTEPGRPTAPTTPGAPIVAPPVVTSPETLPTNPTDPAAPSSPAGPTAPGTTSASVPPSSSVPVTSTPGTTDSGTDGSGGSAPVVPPSTDPVTTAASTTSALPTPTPTPPVSSTDAPAANAASIASASVAGP